jgi:hypothetical protein
MYRKFSRRRHAQRNNHCGLGFGITTAGPDPVGQHLAAIVQPTTIGALTERESSVRPHTRCLSLVLGGILLFTLHARVETAVLA